MAVVTLTLLFRELEISINWRMPLNQRMKHWGSASFRGCHPPHCFPAFPEQTDVPQPKTRTHLTENPMEKQLAELMAHIGELQSKVDTHDKTLKDHSAAHAQNDHVEGKKLNASDLAAPNGASWEDWVKEQVREEMRQQEATGENPGPMVTLEYEFDSDKSSEDQLDFEQPEQPENDEEYAVDVVHYPPVLNEDASEDTDEEDEPEPWQKMLSWLKQPQQQTVREASGENPLLQLRQHLFGDDDDESQTGTTTQYLSHSPLLDRVFRHHFSPFASMFGGDDSNSNPPRIIRLFPQTGYSG